MNSPNKTPQDNTKHLEDEIACLRDALGFYADLENNYNTETGAVSCYRPRGLEKRLYKVLDFGETAREALAKADQIRGNNDTK